MAGDVGFASSNQQYAEQDGKMTPSNMAVGRLPDWNSKVCWNLLKTWFFRHFLPFACPFYAILGGHSAAQKTANGDSVCENSRNNLYVEPPAELLICEKYILIGPKRMWFITISNQINRYKSHRFGPIRIYFSHLRSSAGGFAKAIARVFTDWITGCIFRLLKCCPIIAFVIQIYLYLLSSQIYEHFDHAKLTNLRNSSSFTNNSWLTTTF